MTSSDALERARQSFSSRAWSDAYDALAAADKQASLSAVDLERLAIAAFLVGQLPHSVNAWARAHREFLQSGDPVRAARSAFWVAFVLLDLRDVAAANGWVARAQRLLDAGAHDCVERGYLLLPAALRHAASGDPAGALARFRQATEIGERFGDPDLVALARQGEARALLWMGKIPDGTALLDEVMVAVTTGEVSPLVTGTVYCSVIEACQEIYDLQRAHTWTTALTRWAESQPGLITYRGQCLVYRAAILQVRGAWPAALDAVKRAQEWFARIPADPATGSAFYRQGDLHRLRGEFTQAEEAYLSASQWGRRLEPGLALLRLSQGKHDVAAASIRRAVDETRDRLARSELLPAYVDIMLAVDDLAAARLAADELAQIARALDAPLLHAQAAHAAGAVLLCEGVAQAALAALRRAWAAWQEIEAPYEGARTRVLIALACRELGDEETARIELDAARWSFSQLGAAPDVARVEALSRTHPTAPTAGLTAREVEVLRLVAAGKTNRAIAEDLFISEKTVARHISNIFTKLDLSSRAAATAYAYEHGIVSPST